jgi:hypothetical protein
MRYTLGVRALTLVLAALAALLFLPADRALADGQPIQIILT